MNGIKSRSKPFLLKSLQGLSDEESGWSLVAGSEMLKVNYFALKPLLPECLEQNQRHSI
jgi:hypothetical protein